MSLALSACPAAPAARTAPHARALRSAPQARPMPPPLRLDRDRSARLRAAPGTSFECLAGRAWITLDGDLRDVVLEPGEAFVVDRAATVMVFAFDSPAELRVGEPVGTRRSPAAPGWRARAAYLAVVAGSVLAFFGARCAVAELAGLAAATSL